LYVDCVSFCTSRFSFKKEVIREREEKEKKREREREKKHV
jgi:hypothetical protein